MLDLSYTEVQTGIGFRCKLDHPRREINADGLGTQPVGFSGKRAWSGCYIQKINAAFKSYCIEKRFDSQRCNWREEVAVSLCQIVMALTFEGTKSLCILR